MRLEVTQEEQSDPCWFVRTKAGSWQYCLQAYLLSAAGPPLDEAWTTESMQETHSKGGKAIGRLNVRLVDGSLVDQLP